IALTEDDGAAVVVLLLHRRQDRLLAVLVERGEQRRRPYDVLVHGTSWMWGPDLPGPCCATCGGRHVQRWRLSHDGQTLSRSRRHGPSPRKGDVSGMSSRSSSRPAAAAPGTPADAGLVAARLERLHVGARTELDHRDAFELLVATVLSAQTTDVRVNQVTPGLFSRWPGPAALAEA